MANWCQNEVVLTASTPEAEELLPRLSTAIGNHAFFEFVIPYPPNAHQLSGYDLEMWCVSKWGCKSEPQSIHTYTDSITLDTTIRVVFESKYNPPFGVYEALAKEGFDIYAAYVEDGFFTCGIVQTNKHRTKLRITQSLDCTNPNDKVRKKIERDFSSIDVMEYYGDKDNA